MISTLQPATDGLVTKRAADTLRQADHIFIEELRRAGWYERTCHAYAVFLPVKSVSATGDGRRHAPVIALRALHRPLGRGHFASVYDMSGKPPATIEWE